jgi:molybdopterin-synthase adenylyltransferase
MHQDLWERYSRQMLFAPIGREGQERLLKSRVLVIGLGALGTVIANNLARAGVGYLKLVDRDYVEDSNLQRQILFDEEDVKNNLPKSIAAVQKLKKINSQVTYEGLVDDVNFTNIFSIMGDVDLVVDGTDNFETRYLINEASVSKNVPWIYGACVASYGVTFSIIPGETACLECLWGEGFPAGGGATCDTAGILGPVPSITASLQSSGSHQVFNQGQRCFEQKGCLF